MTETTLPTVTLKRGKSRFVCAGHPWIFSGAIASERGDVKRHDRVQVLDHEGRALGVGLRSPRSQIRVRMLATALADGITQTSLAAHLRALQRRRAWMGLPAPDTNAYRLCNSEGDGAPGLIVDVFDQLVVMQLTTLPMVRRRAIIVAALAEVFPEAAIRETAASEAIAALEGFERVEQWHTEGPPEVVQLTEHGVRFEIETSEFQKTGHFLDMRPHRRWVAERAAGKSVLDAYSYTGGFGLHAGLAGASRVVCVDGSATAIARVQRNAEINGLSVVEAHTSRVEEFLRAAQAREERFDIVVLDPPKLAPKRAAVDKALRHYESLLVEGARVLAPDGVLCITSCSGHIGLPELERALADASLRSGRHAQIIYTGHQGPDHPYPAAMPEGRYATFIGTIA